MIALSGVIRRKWASLSGVELLKLSEKETEFDTEQGDVESGTGASRKSEFDRRRKLSQDIYSGFAEEEEVVSKRAKLSAGDLDLDLVLDGHGEVFQLPECDIDNSHELSQQDGDIKFPIVMGLDQKVPTGWSRNLEEHPNFENYSDGSSNLNQSVQRLDLKRTKDLGVQNPAILDWNFVGDGDETESGGRF